ncbi:hypothetical protein Ancab_033466 [Ancistrocladus abbreviatus]
MPSRVPLKHLVWFYTVPPQLAMADSGKVLFMALLLLFITLGSINADEENGTTGYGATDDDWKSNYDYCAYRWRGCGSFSGKVLGGGRGIGGGGGGGNYGGGIGHGEGYGAGVGVGNDNSGNEEGGGGGGGVGKDSGIAGGYGSGEGFGVGATGNGGIGVGGAKIGFCASGRDKDGVGGSGGGGASSGEKVDSSLAMTRGNRVRGYDGGNGKCFGVGLGDNHGIGMDSA